MSLVIIKPNYRLRGLQPGLLLSLLQGFKRSDLLFQQMLLQSDEYNGLRAERTTRFERLKLLQKERRKTEELKEKIKEREEALENLDKQIHAIQFAAFHTDFFMNVNNALYSFWFKTLQSMLPPTLHRGLGFERPPSVSSSSSSASSRSNTGERLPSSTFPAQHSDTAGTTFRDSPAAFHATHSPVRPRSSTFSDMLASIGGHRTVLPRMDEPGPRSMSMMDEPGPRSTLMMDERQTSHHDAGVSARPISHFPTRGSAHRMPTSVATRGKPSMGRSMVASGDASPPPEVRIPRKVLVPSDSGTVHPRFMEFMEDLFSRDWQMGYYLRPEPNEMQAKQEYLKMLLKTFEFSDAATCTGAAAIASLVGNATVQAFFQSKCTNSPVVRSNAVLFKTVSLAIWNDYMKVAEYLASKNIRVMAPQLFNEEESD